MKYKFVAPQVKKKSGLLSALSFRRLLTGPTPDPGLLFCVAGLLVFGWVMIYSASALFAESRYHDQYFFLKKQIMWSIIGFFAFVVTSNIPLTFWQSKIKYIYGATIVVLLLVLAFAPPILGARRWLRLGGFSVQPSEFAKITMVLLAADYLDRRQSRLRDFKKGVMPLLVLEGVLLLLILAERDLGTPVLMTAVIFTLLLLAGARWRHFFVMGMASLPLIAIAIYRVRYRMERLLAYLNPWADPHGKGYQLIQSLLAMGSGGFFGRGLGESLIKISNLPEAHTDFVFSILGEELGLFGTLACVGLFLFLCLRGLKIAKEASTFFSRLVAAGISLMIGFQALLNMGVASGLFPTKGMPLPFISFGGSSLVITLAAVGLLASISREASVDDEAS